MKLLIKSLGLLIILIGICLLIKPDFIFNWLEANLETTALYITAIVFRLAFGILFLVAAKDSKYPGVIRFIGFIAILAAVIFLFMGHENFQSTFAPLISNFREFAVITAIIAIVLGAFVIYAFTAEKDGDRGINQAD